MKIVFYRLPQKIGLLSTFDNQQKSSQIPPTNQRSTSTPARECPIGTFIISKLLNESNSIF